MSSHNDSFVIVQEELYKLIINDHLLECIKEDFWQPSGIQINKQYKERIFHLSNKTINSSKNKYVKEGQEKIYNIDIHPIPLFWVLVSDNGVLKYQFYDYFEKDRVILKPNQVYRTMTLEWINLPMGVQGWLFPKTSIARLGITVTLIPYVEPGACGAQSLQIINHNEVDFPLEFNKPWAKLILEKSFKGNYGIKEDGWVNPTATPPKFIIEDSNKDLNEKIKFEVEKTLHSEKRKKEDIKSNFWVTLIISVISAIIGALITIAVSNYILKNDSSNIDKTKNQIHKEIQKSD
jgi:deoxycytidine triphosphate deaminase